MDATIGDNPLLCYWHFHRRGRTHSILLLTTFLYHMQIMWI